jgi:choline-glycine betaine transporter
VVMGAIAAIMLVIGAGSGDALTGIQNITIIMAAPFAVVMVVLCVALAKDLHDDPMMRRDRRSTEAVEQAVEYGIDRYGDHFIVSVKPRPNGDATTVTRADGVTGADGAEGSGRT